MEKEQSGKSKKAFFFLRHNNDIDHSVPVIYKWLKTQIKTILLMTIYAFKFPDFIGYLGLSIRDTGYMAVFAVNFCVFTV